MRDLDGDEAVGLPLELYLEILAVISLQFVAATAGERLREVLDSSPLPAVSAPLAAGNAQPVMASRGCWRWDSPTLAQGVCEVGLECPLE